MSRELSVAIRGHRVEIFFDGYNDEGGISWAQVTDKDNKNVAMEADLADKLEQWAYQYLEQHCGGWETGDGLTGRILIQDGGVSLSASRNERSRASEYDDEAY